MNDINSNIKMPKPRRLFAVGKRVIDHSAVVSRKVDENGKLHAIGEPALRFDDGAEEHWFHGRLQSVGDRPALYIARSNACCVAAHSNRANFKGLLVLRPETHVWCADGFVHRENAPAVIHYGDEDSALEEWWHRGLRHRDGDAAVIRVPVRKWYQYGLLHRQDGPAIDYASADRPDRINPHGDSGWYWRGQKMASQGTFEVKFDYEAVPPEFVLRALAYAYAHTGGATTPPEAVARASNIFPDLKSFLESVGSIGAPGKDVADRLHDFLAGRAISDTYAVDDLLDLDPL